MVGESLGKLMEGLSPEQQNAYGMAVVGAVVGLVLSELSSGGDASYLIVVGLAAGYFAGKKGVV